MALPTGGCPGSPQSPPLRGTHTIKVAEDRLEKLYRTEEQKLTEALDRATQKVGEISHEVSDREWWMDDHPHAPAHLAEPPTDPGSDRPLQPVTRRQPQHRQRP